MALGQGLQVSPLTSTRSYRESLDGGLSRRVPWCWPLKAAGAVQVIGSGTPATGRRGTIEFIQQGEKGKPLQTGMQEGCLQAQGTELVFVNVPAAK